ncbi:MAG TPA: isoprenylcysteine carboxylmethyltransferase family protein [Candidatus Acidoferrales bacterium]|nr:isoprenylcysteine carboxylmethyltransferase family protein [Candidatus Acidoferrales bacterium]
MAAPTNFWIRWRVRAGYPAALAFLLFARPSRTSLVIGASVGLVGILIRAWAAGHLRKHEVLATSGPYAFTRNPLYFGSVILAVGFILSGDSIWAGAIVGIYLIFFYPAVMRREEGELLDRYGEEYSVYATRVPLFWPRLWSVSAGKSAPVRFSRRRYLQNREYQAAIGFVLGIGVLWTKMNWMR